MSSLYIIEFNSHWFFNLFLCTISLFLYLIILLILVPEHQCLVLVILQWTVVDVAVKVICLFVKLNNQIITLFQKHLFFFQNIVWQINGVDLYNNEAIQFKHYLHIAFAPYHSLFVNVFVIAWKLCQSRCVWPFFAV